MVVLGLLHDGLIQFKGRHVLRRMGGNQPAVVANGNETPIFITYLSLSVERRGGAASCTLPASQKDKAKAMPVLKMLMLLMC
jgi:hypothetical protein